MPPLSHRGSSAGRSADVESEGHEQSRGSACVADKPKAMRYFGSSPTRGRDGGTGRRSRLKICRPLWSWGFDPPSRHHTFEINALGGVLKATLRNLTECPKSRY